MSQTKKFVLDLSGNYKSELYEMYSFGFFRFSVEMLSENSR